MIIKIIIIIMYNPLIVVSVNGYLILINRANLMLLILKQHLLPVYRFTIKQTSPAVIKRKAFRNHTLFAPLQRFLSQATKCSC